eukprot:4209937-Prymnesium_polylepis.1
MDHCRRAPSEKWHLLHHITVKIDLDLGRERWAQVGRELLLRSRNAEQKRSAKRDRPGGNVVTFGVSPTCRSNVP